MSVITNVTVSYIGPIVVVVTAIDGLGVSNKSTSAVVMITAVSAQDVLAGLPSAAWSGNYTTGVNVTSEGVSMSVSVALSADNVHMHDRFATSPAVLDSKRGRRCR